MKFTCSEDDAAASVAASITTTTINNEDESESDSEDTFENQIKIIKEYDNFVIAEIPVDIFPEIPCWSYNRSLCPQRVKIIKNNFKIYSPCAVVLIDGKYFLIDGQHRQQAIKELINEGNVYFEQTIPVFLYKVETTNEAIDLFMKINDTKPLEPKDTPDAKIIKLVEKLERHFKKAIKDNATRTVYPYITLRDLAEHLRKHYKDKNINVEKEFKKIIEINECYKLTKIPNIRSINKNKSALKKAQTSNFYLGLDEKWSWVDNL